MMRTLALLALALVMSGCSLISTSDDDDGALKPADVPQPDLTYRVGPGDSIFIFVRNNPDVSLALTVRPDGKIRYPLIAGEFHVADKTIDEIEQLLFQALTATGAYEGGRQFFDAETLILTVYPTNIVSQVVTVSGAVGRPGRFPLAGGMTTFDAVALAGGPTLYGDLTQIYVFRVHGGETLRIRVDLEAHQANPKEHIDLALAPGDRVLVSE